MSGRAARFRTSASVPPTRSRDPSRRPSSLARRALTPPVPAVPQEIAEITKHHMTYDEKACPRGFVSLTSAACEAEAEENHARVPLRRH